MVEDEPLANETKRRRDDEEEVGWVAGLYDVETLSSSCSHDLRGAEDQRDPVLAKEVKAAAALFGSSPRAETHIGEGSVESIVRTRTDDRDGGAGLQERKTLTLDPSVALEGQVLDQDQHPGRGRRAVALDSPPNELHDPRMLLRRQRSKHADRSRLRGASSEPGFVVVARS
jgi:hypothetical protein